MKQRKVPMRTCILTKEKLPKQELIRIVKNNEQKVFIDSIGNSNGRGAYIKKDVNILEKLKKSKLLDKHLQIEIPNDIYNELEELLKK